MAKGFNLYACEETTIPYLSEPLAFSLSHIFAVYKGGSAIYLNSCSI